MPNKNTNSFEVGDLRYLRGHIKEHGLDAIQSYIDAESDFSKLDGGEIYSIVNFPGENTIDNNKFTLESIQLLKDAGADFSKLGGSEIYSIINCPGEHTIDNNKFTLESIQLLKDAGADFSKLDGEEIYNIVNVSGENNIGKNAFTLEAIQLLKDAGANQHGILNPNKVSIIKEICKPIIEESLALYPQKIQNFQEEMEKSGLLELLPKNLKTLEDLNDFIGNSAELSNAINALSMDFDDFNYKVTTDGNRAEFITSSIDTDGSSHVFPVSEGKLINHNNYINCQDLIISYEASKSIEFLNNNGFNMELSSVPEYSDSELEALYIHIDLTAAPYSQETCLSYANSHSSYLPGVLDYCPED